MGILIQPPHQKSTPTTDPTQMQTPQRHVWHHCEDMTDREIIKEIVHCESSRHAGRLLEYLFIRKYGRMIVGLSKRFATKGVEPEDIPGEMMGHFVEPQQGDYRRYARLYTFLNSGKKEFGGYLWWSTYTWLLDCVGWKSSKEEEDKGKRVVAASDLGTGLDDLPHPDGPSTPTSPERNYPDVSPDALDAAELQGLLSAVADGGQSVNELEPRHLERLYSPQALEAIKAHMSGFEDVKRAVLALYMKSAEKMPWIEIADRLYGGDLPFEERKQRADTIKRRYHRTRHRLQEAYPRAAF